MNIIQVNKYYLTMIEEARSTYSSLRKAVEKQKKGLKIKEIHKLTL